MHMRAQCEGARSQPANPCPYLCIIEMVASASRSVVARASELTVLWADLAARKQHPRMGLVGVREALHGLWSLAGSREDRACHFLLLYYCGCSCLFSTCLIVLRR